MEIRLGVTHTPSLWVQLVNQLGADIHWTHALIQRGEWMVEASGHGVVLRPWEPERYYEYGLYRLKEPTLMHDEMWAFAMGEVGKRYRFEALPIIARRVLKKIFGRFVERPRVGGAQGGFIGAGEVCTSLADKVFLWGGFDLVPYEKSAFVLPDELADSELLERIE